MKTTHLSLAVLLAATLASGANVGDLSEKKVLTIEGARRVIAGAVTQARRNQSAGAIAVVDDGGNVMAVERLDGTFAAGPNIAIGKARTAALFKLPTKFFEEVIAKGRTSMVALNDFTPLQGGVPLIVDGQIVGAVGVSGAKNADQDNELAMAGAAALSAPLAAVAYFDKDTVSTAFSKGSVLFNAGQTYMVHASRREQPGMAEIHTKDADIIYVLDGTATFVTGGNAVEPATTGPDEIRGKLIEGGEVRQLVKGDVIIVPAGVPHWFKEVSNPFLYYVVKAR